VLIAFRPLCVTHFLTVISHLTTLLVFTAINEKRGTNLVTTDMPSSRITVVAVLIQVSYVSEPCTRIKQMTYKGTIGTLVPLFVTRIALFIKVTGTFCLVR
jgi:hypothetical protein